MRDGNEGNEKGYYVALGSSSCLGGGSQDNEWPGRSRESRIQNPESDGVYGLSKGFHHGAFNRAMIICLVSGWAVFPDDGLPINSEKDEVASLRSVGDVMNGGGVLQILGERGGMFDGSMRMSFQALNCQSHLVGNINKHKTQFKLWSYPALAVQPSSILLHTDESGNLPESKKCSSSKTVPRSTSSLLNQANTVGVIGGVSVVSTLNFLEKLVRWSSKDGEECLPFVVCCDPMLNKEISSRERSLFPYLKRKSACSKLDHTPIVENLRCKRAFLENSGARCIVMPCHISHAWHGEISEDCSVPFLHVGECVARELKEAKLKPLEAGSNLRIGVLSTDATLTAGSYQEQLQSQVFQSVTHICLQFRLYGIRNLVRKSSRVLKLADESPSHEIPSPKFLIGWGNTLILKLIFIVESLNMQGFEVVLPDKATMEHTIIPAVEALNRKDMEGARNLLRIALQVLLVRAVNTVILASDDMKGLLPQDDPLLKKCIDPMDALARSTIKWAQSTENQHKHT
ncbi:hypothetical protein HHK36_021486 [Tetracentron sinense]|uniref:Aspartate racemase n=1 Tax=Tetracentron sinense TaxID=13715 RepID=A0A834YS84_TETSI|nr:hypothetical protein HHK36_021486 [Tetracentron sinense]